MSDISWLELFKKFPDLFTIDHIKGIPILKIVTLKLKEYYPKIKLFLKSQKIGNKEHVLRDSEVKKYIILKEINFDKNSKLIKKYTKTEDWSIYLLGKKALIEKMSYNMLEVMKIKNEAGQLAGQRGRKIINFILQGYFDEIFIPLLIHQIGELEDDSKIFSWFNKFIDEQINFFPRAIWVMNNTSEKDIVRELYRRCVVYQYKDVNIHTIGPTNTKKVEEAFIELGEREDFPKFNFEKIEDLKKSGLYTFRIKIK